MSALIYETADAKVYSGDAGRVLSELPTASIDMLCTDPPYGLSAPPDINEVLTRWENGEDYQHGRPGFMGAEWDSFVPGPGIWREALRVVKPGALALVFAGSRTIDLMMASMRMAGWTILGTRHWTYGAGFPKGLDIAKSLDRAGGVASKEQAVALRAAREAAGLTREQLAELVGCTPASVRDWEEGRTRHKGGEPEWLVPSPAYRARLNDVLGYTSDERAVAKEATARSGDGTVYGLGHRGLLYADDAATELAARWKGWKTQLKSAHEPMVVAVAPGGARSEVDLAAVHPYTPKAPNSERIVAYLPDCGCLGDPHAPGASADLVAFEEARCPACLTAFKTYRHPTVKPLAVASTLVTGAPVDGWVLDPFAGTGTTGVAAVQAGRRAVLIDADPVHAAMARKRLTDAVQPALFDLWAA